MNSMQKIVLKLLLAVLICPMIFASLAKSGSCFQVELAVQERAGASRSEVPMTMGVPFPRGTIFSDQDVQIAGTPAQFKALSTWPDGSVKWLLCDFNADVPAYGNATYYLSDGMGNTSGTPLQATEDADDIVVITGPLKFVVSKTNFNLFQQLWLDLNENGMFETDEEMISPNTQNGAVVTYDSGEQFFSVLDGNVSVELEEVGPLRLVIAAQGWHRNGSGERGLDFTVRIHAYSGQSFLRVFYTFYNRQSTSIGAYWEPPPPPESYVDVEDISLRSHINLQGTASYTFGGSGSTEHSGALSAGQRAYIYGYGTVTPDDLHYQIGGSGSGSGGRARGWADISDSRWGLTTGIRQFWQHHPKGIEVAADGEVWVRIIPEYYDSFPINPSDPWTAADLIFCGAAKTHEVFYYFHEGDDQAANSEDVILSLENPLYATASPQYYCATEVFGKMPPKDLSLIRQEYRWIVQDWENKVETMLGQILDNREDSYWSAKNEYGMWNYGDSYQSEWSNMQYDTPYSLFMQFCRTADMRYFDLAVDQCRHYRDVDIVHHMGDTEPGTLREAFVGSARRLPNVNHAMGYDTDYMGDISLKGPGLIYHYFFTGDRQSLYGGKMQADYVRNSALRYQRDYIFCGPRRFGMGIEALLAYYEASGDQSYLNNGVYQLGDISGSEKASAYTLARKVHEHQNISPDHPAEWAIWGYVGCDCDDGLKFESINYGGCSWQAGMTWDAMLHYYEITGDAVARDDILRGAAWMCDPSRTNLWNGSYFYAYDPDYGDWYEGHGKEGAGFINGVLGFAYGETGNIDYIDKAISALDIQVNHCGATTDPKWFSQVTKTIPRFFYYLTEEYGIQDTLPPNPPTNLQAPDVTEHSISLVWTPSAIASDGDPAYSYSIYRNAAPIATCAAPEYEDSGLPENTAFSYAIYAKDNAGNQSLTAATGTFATLADNTRPAISAVHITGSTSLEVIFSEPVEESSAETVGNYQLDHGMSVLGATLQADLVTVKVNTTTHEEGTTYTLTVNNIRDRAAVPNTILPNSSTSYQFYLQLQIADISRPNYQDVYLNLGEQYYVDRTFTLVDVPEDKANVLWIKTANDDKMSSADVFLTFTTNLDADVYIGYDNRASAVPDWLNSAFTNSGQVVAVSDVGASPMRLWFRHFPAGPVSLGGNMAQGASGAESMYTVFLYAEGATVDTVGPQISNVDVAGITAATSTITWTTDEPADSKVEYGLSAGDYVWSVVNASFTTSHQLNLSGLSQNTMYHYRVISEDQSGNVSVSGDHTFTTESQDSTPPQISQVQVLASTASTAQIAWVTDEPADSKVEYGLSVGDYVWSVANASFATSHQLNLSGLTQNTLYHYRVISEDPSGNVSVSGDDTFTTESQDSTPPQISQVQAMASTASMAQITWTTDEPSDSQVEYGFDTSYGSISFLDSTMVLSHHVSISLPPPSAKGTYPPSGTRENRFSETAAGASGDDSRDATSLNQSGEETVVYHFRVLSRDASGNLAMSADNTFTAESQDQTPPLISNLQISSIRDTSAHVSWETDEPARAVLYYGLEQDDYPWSLVDSTLSISHQFTMEGLTSATRYHLQAWCADGVDNSSLSPDTTFTTQHLLPGQPGKPEHIDD